MGAACTITTHPSKPLHEGFVVALLSNRGVGMNSATVQALLGYKKGQQGQGYLQRAERIHLSNRHHHLCDLRVSIRDGLLQEAQSRNIPQRVSTPAWGPQSAQAPGLALGVPQHEATHGCTPAHHNHKRAMEPKRGTYEMLELHSLIAARLVPNEHTVG